MSLPKNALTEYLRESNVAYFARLEALRESVAAWLEYVPHTFPHYTRHTVGHSDEITGQLSQILFVDGNVRKPSVPLSTAEFYILCSAAYLHDVGMVVADQEKAAILNSEAWRTWTTGDGGGAKRWAEIAAFRQGNAPADEAGRHFLADLQVRFLIAEFVRRVHHTRARQILTAHHEKLGDFAFGDVALLRTISDVCVGHGLRSRDLEDPDKYPDRRTLRGEQVNVRFIALLLRIGDLLDMSSARACPMLISAASPLPPDSLGHWHQYDRILHRVTAPDRIEVLAECETQDEHRLLQDWCTWLVEETQSAQIIMARASRHSDWRAPEVRIDPPAPTIRIRAAKTASYTPSRWSFELDAPAVLERLIKDIYKFPLSFVRELLQNGLDATRARMYDDLQAVGTTLPASPTKAQSKVRENYSLTIALEDVTVENALSGEKEHRHVLIVDDKGIGMDSNIIQRFLLQIGRSYYTSDEFRDHYSFIPTSRFGVGFLSVFAVSDHVTVETFKPSSTSGEGPVLLTLTGPRAYLLTSQGKRAESGTRVAVRLREQVDSDRLIETLRHWCRRIEFPVIVRILGDEFRIDAEQPKGFSNEEAARAAGAEGVAAVTPFPIHSDTIEGEIYIPSYTTKDGTSWAERRKVVEAAQVYPRGDELGLPGTLICLHGINTADPRFAWRQGWDRRTDSLIARLDIRGVTDSIPLSRQGLEDHLSSNKELLSDLEPTYSQLLTKHMSETPFVRGERGWMYKQRLAKEFPLPTFWHTLPESMRAFRNGAPVLLSLSQILSEETLVVIFGPSDIHVTKKHREQEIQQALGWKGSNVVLVGGDLDIMAAHYSYELFGGLSLKEAALSLKEYPAITYVRGPSGSKPFASAGGYGKYPMYLFEYPLENIFCVSLSRSYSYGAPLLLNTRHPFTTWLKALRADADGDGHRISRSQVNQLLDLIESVGRHSYYEVEPLNEFVRAWVALGSLPADLRPPTEPLSSEGFLRR